MAKSYYSAAGFLNYVGRNVSFAQPTNLYVAMYTSNPGFSDSGTEVSYTGYVRQPVTLGAPVSDSNTAKCTTTSAVIFPVAGSAGSGSVTHIGLRTADTAGELIYYAALSTPFTIASGSQPVIPVGGIVIRES